MQDASAVPESTTWIVPSLQPLAIQIDSLVPDDRNANQHNEAGIRKIAGSLREYGQRKPIVVQKKPTGELMIRAGHGTVEAAKLNGETHIAAVIVEEDDRTATGFGIADNATGRYSSWDEAVLGELLNDQELFDDPDLVDMQLDLEGLLDGIGDPLADDDEKEDEKPKKEIEPPPESYSVLVKLANEEQQAELLERLSGEGYECRAFMS